MARLNLKEVGGLLPDDPLFREFETMLATYEAWLTQKNGRKTRAYRTWAKLSKVGIVKCLETWAAQSRATEGYKTLVANGQVDLTAEAIVLRHPDRFSSEAVAAAQRRLSENEQSR